jgi:hypothetical protein
MDIDRDLAHEYRPALTSKGYTAPMEAFAALLAFGRPQDLQTWYDESTGGTRWLILGRLSGGLVILDAESPVKGWDWEPHFQNERSARAEWYPIEAIESVQVTSVNLHGSSPDAMISGDVAWQLIVRGRGEIQLPITTQIDPGDFCRQLIADRTSSR